MRDGFGRGHDFDMNRLRLQQGEYLNEQLEKLEKSMDEKEDNFDELCRYLGHQYCYGLEPSVIGFKRCLTHLFLEQCRTYLILGIILFVGDRIWQLTSIFIVWNVYYGI